MFCISSVGSNHFIVLCQNLLHVQKLWVVTQFYLHCVLASKSLGRLHVLATLFAISCKVAKFARSCKNILCNVGKIAENFLQDSRYFIFGKLACKVASAYQTLHEIANDFACQHAVCIIMLTETNHFGISIFKNMCNLNSRKITMKSKLQAIKNENSTKQKQQLINQKKRINKISHYVF